MAKKSKRKRLTDRLDDLCREIVRIIYKDTCEICGNKVYGHNSHPCHIVAKGKGASWRRFDLLNIFLGCFKCHRWWHDNPLESANWLEKKFPARVKYLEKYTNGKPCKITDSEMEELIIEYKEKRNELFKETDYENKIDFNISNVPDTTLVE